MSKIFSLEDYCGKYAMHCNTVEKAVAFCAYLRNHGRTWKSGAAYGNSCWKANREKTVYLFNEGLVDHAQHAAEQGYILLEYGSFDWTTNNEPAPDLKSLAKNIIAEVDELGRDITATKHSVLRQLTGIALAAVAADEASPRGDEYFKRLKGLSDGVYSYLKAATAAEERAAEYKEALEDILFDIEDEPPF